MDDISNLIRNKIEKANQYAKQLLMDTFPYLYFYVSPTHAVHCWVRTKGGQDGAGIQLKYSINASFIPPFHLEYLKQLNAKVKSVYLEPEKYFYCTECGEVKPMEEFSENVFAGYYCKECAKKPEIAKIIEESHKRGFYD